MASSRGAEGNVKIVDSDSNFQKELLTAGDKLVVVDFFATWCGPCKVVAPKFLDLSNKYPDVIFLKVDVDICRSTAKRYEVNAMPTFVFFRNREKLNQVRGANIEAVEGGLLQHSNPSEATTVATSNVSIPGQISLHSLINKTGSECLNEAYEHPYTHALTPDSAQFLESDCDEQLIVSLAFMQPVKLHTIQLSGPTGGHAPKTVKLFINQLQTIDFDQAEQRKPIQEFVLTEEEVSEDGVIPLHYVKYQNVQNLTLFIKDNQGGQDTTIVHYIGIYGNPLEITKMSEFKRVAGEKGERH